MLFSTAIDRQPLPLPLALPSPRPPPPAKILPPISSLMPSEREITQNLSIASRSSLTEGYQLFTHPHPHREQAVHPDIDQAYPTVKREVSGASNCVHNGSGAHSQPQLPQVITSRISLEPEEAPNLANSPNFAQNRPVEGIFRRINAEDRMRADGRQLDFVDEQLQLQDQRCLLGSVDSRDAIATLISTDSVTALPATVALPPLSPLPPLPPSKTYFLPPISKFSSIASSPLATPVPTQPPTHPSNVPTHKPTFVTITNPSTPEPVPQYNLHMLQQPISARACGYGERDRRVIDPPPILRMKIDGLASAPPPERSLQMPYTVVHCQLWDGEHDGEALARHHHNKRPLLGTQVAAPFYGRDEFDVHGCFFAFPDLSVRSPGIYRLRFSLIVLQLYDMGVGRSAPVRATVLSQRFAVVSAKNFEGIRKSSELTRRLSQQGCAIGVKRGRGRVEKERGREREREREREGEKRMKAEDTEQEEPKEEKEKKEIQQERDDRNSTDCKVKMASKGKKWNQNQNLNRKKHGKRQRNKR